nr:hypothetical protein [Ardenticatena sp.]
MFWIVPVMFGTFLMAGAGVLDKCLVKKQAVTPVMAVLSFGAVGLPVGAVGIWLNPRPTVAESLLALLSGGLFVVAVWLYYDTIGREDVSRLMPLLRLTTPQSLLFGTIFLNEIITGRQIWAVGVMLVGSMLLILKPHATGLTVSWAALRLLPVTTVLAVNQVLMAYVYRSTSLWVGIAWENLGVAIGAGLVWCLWRLRRQRQHGLPADDESVKEQHIASKWGVLILEQSLRLVTGLAPAWAVAHGVPVGLVSAVGGIRAFWVWGLAVLVLGEPVERRDVVFKGTGILGMGLGIYLLT